MSKTTTTRHSDGNYTVRKDYSDGGYRATTYKPAKDVVGKIFGLDKVVKTEVKTPKK